VELFTHLFICSQLDVVNRCLFDQLHVQLVLESFRTMADPQNILETSVCTTFRNQEVLT